MPTYETQADKVAQRLVAEALREKWNCEFIKMPEGYPVDFLFVDQLEGCWVEVKRRYGPSSLYPTYMIDKSKVDFGLRISAATHLPFGVAFQWDDGIFFSTIKSDTPAEYGYGGRRDRRDQDDLDYVAKFDAKLFEKVS